VPVPVCGAIRFRVLVLIGARELKGNQALARTGSASALEENR